MIASFIVMFNFPSIAYDVKKGTALSYNWPNHLFSFCSWWMFYGLCEVICPLYYYAKKTLFLSNDGRCVNKTGKNPVRLLTLIWHKVVTIPFMSLLLFLELLLVTGALLFCCMFISSCNNWQSLVLWNSNIVVMCTRSCCYNGSCCRMAPEVIACDQDPTATYDQRVSCGICVWLHLLWILVVPRVTSGL